MRSAPSPASSPGCNRCWPLSTPLVTERGFRKPTTSKPDWPNTNGSCEDYIVEGGLRKTGLRPSGVGFTIRQFVDHHAGALAAATRQHRHCNDRSTAGRRRVRDSQGIGRHELLSARLLATCGDVRGRASGHRVVERRSSGTRPRLALWQRRSGTHSADRGALGNREECSTSSQSCWQALRFRLRLHPIGSHGLHRGSSIEVTKGWAA